MLWRLQISVIPTNPTAAAQLAASAERQTTVADVPDRQFHEISCTRLHKIGSYKARSPRLLCCARLVPPSKRPALTFRGAERLQALPSVVTWLDAGSHPALRWLEDRPFVLGTERDQVCEVHWRPSWRCLLVRN